jgi:hypothetical protein
MAERFVLLFVCAFGKRKTSGTIRCDVLGLGPMHAWCESRSAGMHLGRQAMNRRDDRAKSTMC